MAYNVLDPSVFAARLGNQLVLEVSELFPLDRHLGVESLPRVTLLRATDLLNLRLAFVGLVLEDTAAGRVLRRADDAAAGYVLVLFGGQHLHERAFFEVTRGVDVQTPGSFTESPRRPPDPVPLPDPLLRPPVPVRIAGPSRLALEVHDDRIPWSAAGLLAAVSRLPLSIAPHAGAESFLVDTSTGVGGLLALEVGEADGARVSGSVHAAVRTLASAMAIQARFGTSAAAAGVVAAHRGTGTFRLDAQAETRLGELLQGRRARLPMLPPAPQAGPHPDRDRVALAASAEPARGSGFRARPRCRCVAAGSRGGVAFPARNAHRRGRGRERAGRPHGARRLGA